MLLTDEVEQFCPRCEASVWAPWRDERTAHLITRCPECWTCIRVDEAMVCPTCDNVFSDDFWCSYDDRWGALLLVLEMPVVLERVARPAAGNAAAQHRRIWDAEIANLCCGRADEHCDCDPPIRAADGLYRLHNSSVNPYLLDSKCDTCAYWMTAACPPLRAYLTELAMRDTFPTTVLSGCDSYEADPLSDR